MASPLAIEPFMSAALEPIAVVGTGYVGLVTGACLAAEGHDVYCIESNRPKAERLAEGEIPFKEPRLDKILENAGGRLHFEPDYEHAWRKATEKSRLYFLAVGTPTQSAEKSAAGLKKDQITSALHSGADFGLRDRVKAGKPTAIVMKSTVPPGTGQSVQKDLADLGCEGATYVACPEFLREGNAVRDFYSPDRLVLGGSDKWAIEALERVFSFARGRVRHTTVASAELVKLASNGFLALAISYANELANLCDDLGYDYSLVLDEMLQVRSEEIPRQSFLRPGPGFGGSCFPKDVREFNLEIRKADPQAKLFDAVLEVNAAQPARVIDKLEQDLGQRLDGKRIALLGLSFKADTDDMREASSERLARELMSRGAAVVAFDPMVKGPKQDDEHTQWLDEIMVEGGDSPYAVLDGADAAILVTDWANLTQLDWGKAARKMSGERPPVLDSRNALDAQALQEAGIAYDGVGRGAAVSNRRFSRNGLAEFAELAADGYLALKREFHDELANACGRFEDASVEEVAGNVARDGRIGLSYLDPDLAPPLYDLDDSVAQLLEMCPPGHMRLLQALRLRAS